MEALLESSGAEPAAPPAPNQFLTFTSGHREYAIDVMAVREIRSWSPACRLPDEPHGARGVLDIRGSVVEIYDLSALLGGSATEAAPGSVVLVVSLDTGHVGLIVDTVSDIIFATEDDFLPSPTVARNPETARMSGIVRQNERLLAILDLQRLFPKPAERWVVD